MDIQKYFDNLAWISNSGDGAAYAPHIRKEPLRGVAPKAFLVNFGKGDQSAPNPRTTQLLRAGGYSDVTTFYRNDLAYPQRVHVCARINIVNIRIGLLRTDIARRSQQTSDLGEQRLARHRRYHCLCQAEVNYPRLWLAVHFHNQNVRGFQVTMNDRFLVRVLDTFTHVYEQPQSFLNSQSFFVAIVGDRKAIDVLH